MRWRYWQKENKRFGWGTERSSDGKFHAVIYRGHIVNNSLTTWRKMKDIAFGRRKIAKARAHQWYQKALEAQK